MANLVAIDAGLGAVKYCYQSLAEVECGILDSVLAAPRRLGYGESQLLTIGYEGTETVIGHDARSCRMSRSCWSSGKVSPDVRLLVLGVLGQIAYQSGKNYLEVDLASALPVGLWATDREKFVDLLRGVHKFYLNGMHYQVCIDFHADFVLPEPLGTFFYLQQKGLVGEGEVVGIIDLGHSTVDFALVDNGQFIAQNSSHRDIGMRVFYQLVCEEFAGVSGIDLDPVLIEEKYTSKVSEFRQLGQNYDLSNIFATARKHYGEQVLSAMLSAWKGVGLDRIVLTGGGATTVLEKFADYLGKRMEDWSPEAIARAAMSCDSSGILMVSPDWRSANARGLKCWLDNKKSEVAA